MAALINKNMAQRRMFSLQVVDTDAFLGMPVSSQLLYFHLGMQADDDGFVANPKKIMKIIGASEDDFKILVAKRFILTFESGIIVIKHWRMNNYIQNDRYQETKYSEEKKLLIIKDNGAYTERIHNVSTMDTQVRLGEERLGEVSVENPPAETAGFKDEVNLIFEIFYKTINPQINFGRKDSRDAAQWLIEHKGFEQTLKAAQYACQIFAEEYAPSIKTPAELKNKWANLVKYGMTKEGPKKGHLTL